MVVDNLDIVCITLPELEADTPPCIDGHRPLSPAISFEFMQPDALEWTDILQRLGNVQGCQQFAGDLEIQSPKLIRHFAVPHSAAGGIAPRPNHGKNVLRLSVSVKMRPRIMRDSSIQRA
jgi:hypothetical protein